MDIDIKLLKCFIHDPMDINKLGDMGYDNEDKTFINNFKQLCDLGYLRSSSNNFGLHLSSDDKPSWSCVDIHLSDKGQRTLYPPKVAKPSLLSRVTKHPTVSTVVGGIIVTIIVAVYISPWQASNQKQLQENNKQQGESHKTSKPPK